ncbi:MAG: hypothetical protein GTN36_04255 [Candidatus Aenigmarchaeota archaeon]|nr:hypothetical protein [Candidatus Aenigmarchaeota archaeon]
MFSVSKIEKGIRIENLALTLKFIIYCKKRQFKAKNLANQSGLGGRLFGGSLRTLVRDGYLTVERSSRSSRISRYNVKNFEELERYYEEIKSKLPEEFVESVLEDV